MNTYIRTITLITAVIAITACTSKAESSYMNRCTASGNDSSACSCAYDNIKDHYPSEWMDHLGENGWFPNDFIEVSAQAVQQCNVK